MIKELEIHLNTYDTITVEKVEKYRSSEYVNTTYYVKN